MIATSTCLLSGNKGRELSTWADVRRMLKETSQQMKKSRTALTKIRQPLSPVRRQAQRAVRSRTRRRRQNLARM